MTRLWTTMVWLLAAMGWVGAQAQSFTTLVNFDNTNGWRPENVSLVQGPDGLLYGTTSYGGASGLGTVFAISPEGAFQIIHSFSGADGQEPYAGLTLGANGLLYGTTLKGGADGVGTVFQIGPGGTFTKLHDFSSSGGATSPYGTVIQASNGSLYGTLDGGAGGAVFELPPDGQIIQYWPPDWLNGISPAVGLVEATNGLLYGTDSSGLYDNGEVFSVSLSGTYARVYEFDLDTDPDDGASPYGPLIQASDGNLYGTTSYGGAFKTGDGTVFKLTPAGALTTLHSFDGEDGRDPVGALVEGSDGNFYGTTSGFGGAPNSYGTVFQITPGGTLITLHTFDKTDGSRPLGGLVQATNGSFYGTTDSGGPSTAGTVFRLSVGLKPFVNSVPAFGAAGTPVLILGYDLTGATSVTFNGVAAAFTVVSPTLITATVPAGGSSGAIQVVTPGAMLLSNVPFVVP